MTNYLLEDRHQVSKMPENIRRSFAYIGMKAFESSLADIHKKSLLIAESPETIERIFRSLPDSFFEKQATLRSRISLLVLGAVSPDIQFTLKGLFREVIVIPGDASLPLNEILEIISAKNRSHYVIGGQMNYLVNAMTLIRGDLSKLVVPFSAFRPSGSRVKPDFKRFSVDDFGQTIKLGDYESSVDAILYEYDLQYRKEQKVQLAKKDKSFGACLRRLRILKGLKQTDFHGVDAREIGRIERGEVEPRNATIEKISKCLGVRPSEIGTF